MRVVVADGGSRDATRAVVAGLASEFPNLELIDNPGRLQSAALNRIVETCARPEHRVLVRCDAHAVYPPGYVLRVAASLAAREAAALAVPMDAVGAGRFQRAAAWVVDTPLGSGGAPHRGGRRSGWVDHGHHAGIRLDWFRRVGGYDPGFSHNEDAELDHRLTLAGGRIWLDARIRVAYPMRATPAALARQYWRYGRGRARTVLKHRLRPRPRQLAPVLTVGGAGARPRCWRRCTRRSCCSPPATSASSPARASGPRFADARPPASGPDRRSPRCTSPGARASSRRRSRTHGAASRSPGEGGEAVDPTACDVAVTPPRDSGLHRPPGAPICASSAAGRPKRRSSTGTLDGPLARFFVLEPRLTDLIAKAAIDRRLAAIVTPTIEGLGFELVRLRLMGGGRAVLQIMAEKPGRRHRGRRLRADQPRGLGGARRRGPDLQRIRARGVEPGIDRPLTRLKDFETWAGYEAKLETAEADRRPQAVQGRARRASRTARC